MELNIRKFFLSHLQQPGAFGQKHGPLLLVEGNVRVAVLYKRIQLFFIGAANPKGFVKVNLIKAGAGIVFGLEPVLYYLKLERTHGSNYFAAIYFFGEQLRHALVGKLLKAFLQLLGFHRVEVGNVSE